MAALWHRLSRPVVRPAVLARGATVHKRRRLAAAGHDGATAGVSSEFESMILLIILVIGIRELSLSEFKLWRSLPNVIELFR